MSSHRSVPPNPSGSRQRGDPASGHTPLDRVMIDAVVDSVQGVAGALTTAEAIKAVDEFVRLNGRRHVSYFHAGFRDALLGRAFDTVLPAENDSRARWYWAGGIQGLARSRSWDWMVEVYHSTETVRALGDGRDMASRMAGEHMAEALWKTGRTSDLPRFVGVPLAERPAVFELLMEAGTESLRAGSPGVARAVFDLLLNVGESLPPENSLAANLPTVRRRKAHCLRMLGEHHGAVHLLRTLLHQEANPDVHAMVHADLGLLKGRFALLDQVRIPSDESERNDLVDRLKAGEQHFRDAVAGPSTAYESHGHYCLGVLALADDTLDGDRFQEAAVHLEKARAAMHGKSDYPASLLAQVDLYLGLAKSQLLDAAEIHHAASLIVSGLQGAAIPRHLVAAVVDALECSKESIERVAGPLLASGGDEVLDALATTGLLGTRPIAERLHERAHRATRPRSKAAADLRRALKGYLGVADADAAGQVLDELEHLAVDGFGVAEFLAILRNSDRYDPAWSWEDAEHASARILEGKGEFEQSLAMLRPLFHWYAKMNEFSNAAAVLDRIKAFGLEAEAYADLEARYDGLAGASGTDAGDPAAGAGVNVLVVGGDETQVRGTNNVKAKLASRDRHVTAEFVHTGWESNWNRYLEEIKTRMENCDAVVVRRLMRTHLGRHVRAMCRKRSIPWRLCWSRGQGGLVVSILNVAGVVRRER